MISSISRNNDGDSYSAYAQFSTNGYLLDENLNSVQNNNHLQQVSNPFNRLANKMETNGVDVNFSVFDKANDVRNQWCPDSAQKMTNADRLSTNTDDSDSSRSFKNIEQLHAASSGKSDEEKPMPDHHARRPMNAFLIFCKRHRTIVRERYPNLENR